MKKYAASCEAALTELFTKYGELFEIWFDGGVRPPEEGGPRAREIIERLQPNAILFQGPKNARNVVRWVGNERGVAPYPCWAADSDTTQEDGTKEGRYCGDPNGRVWCPGECDVPLGPGKWMCTCTKDRYWTMDELMRIYDCSVGRNCNLLLNAAPQPDGLILESEMKTYAEFGRRIKGRYANRLAAAEGEGDRLELAIPKDSGPVNQVILAERIEQGERIRKFDLEALVAAEWKKLYSGTCVGHKHIVRFDKAAASRLRLSVTASAAKPLIRDFSAYCN